MSDTAGDELVPYTDRLPIPEVLRPARADVHRETEIAVRPTWVRLHSQLPPTLMWGYNGTVPGPTIEVRRGERVRIAWTNRVPRGSEYPVTAVEVPVRPPGTPPATTEAGRGGVEANADVAALPAWTVTHLHGAQTGGGNDGWADNAVAEGDAQLSEYPNDHQAVQWWYHDHAMNITRFNVYTGLVGTYLLRDDEEDALRLPCGEREMPLILADRNLDTDEDGRLNGRLLHKTIVVDPKNAETGRPVSLPFTGPFTTVNGVIWPYLEADAAWYRFRLVNASNARIYDLVLLDEEDNPVPGVLHQIGSDGGLLPAPVTVGFDAALPTLTVAPAERMDLLLDLRELEGRSLRLVNKGAGSPAGVPDPVNNVRYPHVMEFRVRECPEPDAFVLPQVLSGSFRRYAHGQVHHGHRLIVLTPPGTVGGGGHPEIWEMAEVTEGPTGPHGRGDPGPGRRRHGEDVPADLPHLQRRPRVHRRRGHLRAVELPEPRRARPPDAHPPRRLPADGPGRVHRGRLRREAGRHPQAGGLRRGAAGSARAQRARAEGRLPGPGGAAGAGAGPLRRRVRAVHVPLPSAGARGHGHDAAVRGGAAGGAQVRPRRARRPRRPRGHSG